MKIALFGGAFDPPHLGHRVVANSLIKNKVADEVWFVPVFKHPWADRYNKKYLASYDSRVEMLDLTVGDIDGVQTAHYKDISFTFNTLEFFSKEYPEHDFSWVMGSEYLGRFDDFLKGHPQLIDYPFYIYPRAGFEFNEELKKQNMTFLYNMPEIKASSTEVKKMVKNNNDFSNLVTKPVKEFIEENSLYKAS